MRRIDADELKKAIYEWRYHGFYDKLIEVIDNAPTVEPEERPKGEWILGTPTEYYPEPNPVCPFCNYGNDDTSNYCPRCGSRLVIPNG